MEGPDRGRDVFMRGVNNCARNCQQLLMAWAIVEIQDGEPRRGLDVLRHGDLSPPCAGGEAAKRRTGPDSVRHGDTRQRRQRPMRTMRLGTRCPAERQQSLQRSCRPRRHLSGRIETRKMILERLHHADRSPANQRGIVLIFSR